MTPRTARLLVAWAGLPLVALAPRSATGQERCDLRINAARRTTVEAPGAAAQGGRAYTTHLGGGTVTLRCGGAVMTGDSAVYYESDERAEMIGRVSYRDTTRTLSANRLTYYEPSGQIVAQGDVELFRLANRFRLRSPRASFYRAGSGGGRTLATGRPHMTMPPGDGGEPIEVDADEAEFVGDTLSIGRGDVVIRRSDFDATADSAVFHPALGRLYGRPVVTARTMRLEGDSLHAGFSGGALDRLHAFGSARGEGETVELEADEIVVQWEGDDVHRIEAFGDGRSLAAATEFLIAGDSLDVAFTAGDPDSVTAVGTARTFQLAQGRDTTAALVEPEPQLSDSSSWIAGDSIRGWLEAGAAGPGAEAGVAGSPRTRIRRLLASGNARSYFSAVRDSARSARPSRNYIVGSSIDITFSRGDPESVVAKQAIGVYLEPTDRPRPNSAASAPAGAGSLPGRRP
ncbi:MAG: hypothetical protein PVF05_05730 [Gemmatimonadales bacterium]